MVLGDSGVGKTSLIERFTKGEFDFEQQATVGLDYKNRTYKLDGKTIRVQIWDTAGQEIYRSLAAISLRDADGVVLIYDTTNESSFQNIGLKWMNLIQNSCRKQISLTLISNKVDLEEQSIVPRQDGEKLAEQYSARFFETSAKTFVNVEEAFDYLVRAVYIKVQEANLISKRPEVQLDSEKKGDVCECHLTDHTGRCW